jgi:isopenicillin N synthase-like dioxygenase
MPLSPEDALAGQTDIDKARKVSVDEIPIIDVGPLVRMDPSGEKDVVRQMVEAYREYGFLYIKNHGIPQDLIDRAFAAQERFFDLPVEEKQKIPIDRNQRGWIAPNGQVQLHGKKPNLSESFIFGLDLPPDDPERISGKPFYASNQWPDCLPEFRATLEEYWRAVRYDLAPKLMRGLAMAMRQDPDFFDDKCRKPPGYIRCVTYPPAPGPFDGQFGAGPHTDTNALTILAQDNVGGLQIRRLDGEWIDAPSIPGTYILNIGDMVMRFTNGFFRSTPHRVVSNSERRRFSLPFFMGFDSDVKIEPLAEFCSPDNPPKFEPVIWGEYAMRSFSRQYAQFKED